MRKVSPKYHAFCHKFLNYQKKVPQLLLCMQVMIESYKKLCLQEFFLLFTSISEHLLGYITYSFDRFCSSNHDKVRNVRISEIWIRGKLTCFVHSDPRGVLRTHSYLFACLEVFIPPSINVDIYMDWG